MGVDVPNLFSAEVCTFQSGTHRGLSALAVWIRRGDVARVTSRAPTYDFSVDVGATCFGVVMSAARRAFSMMEVTLSVLLVGVVLAASLNMLAGARQAQAQLDTRARAAAAFRLPLRVTGSVSTLRAPARPAVDR